jgi:hypothetical protein
MSSSVRQTLTRPIDGDALLGDSCPAQKWRWWLAVSGRSEDGGSRALGGFWLIAMGIMQFVVLRTRPSAGA